MTEGGSGPVAEPADGDEVSMDEIADLVERLTADLPDGEGLDALTHALVSLSVRCAVTSLDVSGSRRFIELALDEGATPDQVQEVLTLVSGLGVHTLFESSRQLADAVELRGGPLPELDDTRRKLLQRHVGSAAYWARMNSEIPGFFDALLRLSPETFAGFFEFSGIAWRTHALRSVTKELISLAADATPTHRYLPGVRLHLANAVECGAGRQAILSAVAIARDAPGHRGVR